MDPNLTCLLAAQYVQDRMAEAQSARTVRDVKRSSVRDPKLYQLRRRFSRRSPAEHAVPAASTGVAVPPLH